VKYNNNKILGQLEFKKKTRTIWGGMWSMG
jgi:hypothetical protein